MYERRAVVRIEEGLHARPAAKFVQIAKAYAADIEVVSGEKAVNGKSAVKLMLLGVKEGTEIVIRGNGDDATRAVDELAALVTGESEASKGLNAGAHGGGTAPLVAPALVETPAPATSPGDGIVGVPASDGHVIGPVFVIEKAPLVPDRRRLSPREIDDEKAAFRAALSDLAARFAADAAKAEGTGEILLALADLARDDSVVEAVEGRIAGGSTAAAAVLDATTALGHEFARMPDPYFAARAEDVRHLGRHVAARLLGVPDTDPSQIAAPCVVVAAAIDAFDLSRLPLDKVMALVTQEGTATSHIAIVARALGIPAVLGVRDGFETLKTATTVAVSGSEGRVHADPDGKTRASFETKIAAAEEQRRLDAEWRDVAPKTRDGRAIEIAANIGSPAELDKAIASGAMGVGLFRTEFLFMERRSLPTEDEQYAAYAKVASAFGDRPVVIRTLDVGGDKPLPGIAAPHEENPFLGWRGIRMCLDLPAVFKPQLRALLRAAVHGNIQVMFPMIAVVEELREAKALMETCRAELEAEGVPCAMPAIGVMVETPAAAFTADLLAAEVDFFSIGTNDLTQYTMAADRMNPHPRLARLCRADNIAVLRAVKMIADAAHARGIWVGVCGEAAGDPALIPELVKAGVTELSMSPSRVARAKRIVSELDLSQA